MDPCTRTVTGTGSAPQAAAPPSQSGTSHRSISPRRAPPPTVRSPPPAPARPPVATAPSGRGSRSLGATGQPGATRRFHLPTGGPLFGPPRPNIPPPGPHASGAPGHGSMCAPRFRFRRVGPEGTRGIRSTLSPRAAGDSRQDFGDALRGLPDRLPDLELQEAPATLAV